MELAHGDLDADAGEEADEHGPRQEVGQEPEAQEAGQDEDDAHHEGGQAGQGDPLRRRDRDAHGRDARVEDDCGRRVGTDHQVARRTEDGEEDEGEVSVYSPVTGGMPAIEA